MRPRRTPSMRTVFTLPGGTEDNDLWVRQCVTEAGEACIESVWSLEPSERRAIADGANIVLRVYGHGTPATAMYVTDEQPGR